MKNEEELLDQFAAVALNGILANHELWRSLCADKASFSRNKNDTMEDYVAQQAYKIADAMIKEKEYGNVKVLSYKRKRFIKIESFTMGVELGRRNLFLIR